MGNTGYDSANMHKRFWHSEDYRYRRFDDIKIGDKLKWINGDVEIVAIEDTRNKIGGTAYLPNAINLIWDKNNSLQCYKGGMEQEVILVKRRDGETFRKPVYPDDFE